MAKNHNGVKIDCLIKVNLGDWDLGDWPERIEKQYIEMTVCKRTRAVEFTFDPSKLSERVARTIVKEGIQAFFEDGIWLSISKDGLIFDERETGKHLASVTVDWRSILAKDYKAIEAIEGWAREERELFGDDDNDSYELSERDSTFILMRDRINDVIAAIEQGSEINIDALKQIVAQANIIEPPRDTDVADAQ